MTMALLALIPFAAQPANDGDAPLVTDRPDFTESPFAVAVGRVQLEMGYTFAFSSGDGERTWGHSVGEALVRVGVADRLELRIEAPSLEFLRSSSDSDHAGFSDLGLGVKLNLLEQADAIPNLGIIAGVSLPTGSDPFSADAVVPGATLAWSYDLSERLSIAGNFGAAAASDEDGRHFEGATSLALGFSLTDRIGCYAEYFTILPSGGRDDAHYVNGGLTWLVNNDFQLDIRIGTGLTAGSDDLFAGIGFARRW